jgi:hypothetical protein
MARCRREVSVEWKVEIADGVEREVYAVSGFEETRRLWI